MRKNKTAIVCNIIGVLLIVWFAINTVLDYQSYVVSFNSAPFRIWIYANIVFYYTWRVPPLTNWISGGVNPHILRTLPLCEYLTKIILTTELMERRYMGYG